jgi:hypothetical protein
MIELPREHNRQRIYIYINDRKLIYRHITHTIGKKLNVPDDLHLAAQTYLNFGDKYMTSPYDSYKVYIVDNTPDATGRYILTLPTYNISETHETIIYHMKYRTELAVTNDTEGSKIYTDEFGDIPLIQANTNYYCIATRMSGKTAIFIRGYDPQDHSSIIKRQVLAENYDDAYMCCALHRTPNSTDSLYISSVNLTAHGLRLTEMFKPEVPVFICMETDCVGNLPEHILVVTPDSISKMQSGRLPDAQSGYSIIDTDKDINDIYLVPWNIPTYSIPDKIDIVLNKNDINSTVAKEYQGAYNLSNDVQFKPACILYYVLDDHGNHVLDDATGVPRRIIVIQEKTTISACTKFLRRNAHQFIGKPGITLIACNKFPNTTTAPSVHVHKSRGSVDKSFNTLTQNHRQNRRR